MESTRISTDIDLSRAGRTPQQQPLASTSGAILPTQRRLAEITEMIHVASLLHDDSSTHHLPSWRTLAPSAFGNKLSILGATSCSVVLPSR